MLQRQTEPNPPPKEQNQNNRHTYTNHPKKAASEFDTDRQIKTDLLLYPK